jgi:hypothetical protein
MKRQCDGDCNTMVKLDELVEIPTTDERMCAECAATWLDTQLEAKT